MPKNTFPTKWALLKVGDNKLIKDGASANLKLTKEKLLEIVDYFNQKGEDIPIDSNHYLYFLAKQKGLDETEVAKMIPSNVAAMGYGKLSIEEDKLIISAKWTPLAEKLLEEKIFKYFSPVVQGLKNPPLRVTSVAMENEPALNNLDALVASANKKREFFMEKLQKAVGKLIGSDELVLSSDDEATANAVEAKANLIANIRKELDIADAVSDDAIIAALKSLIIKAGGSDDLVKQVESLTEKVDTLTMSANKKQKEDLISQGLRDGKIVPSTQEIWESLDVVSLSAQLAKAPVICPPGKTAENLNKEDVAALTASDKMVAKAMGFSEEEFLKAKKGE